MLFTLEALNARHGDSLLLHYGTEHDPGLIVIDGGPSGVSSRLLGRLKEIKEDRSPDDPLPIRMVMISHIDDDHIRGILDWFEDLAETQERQEQLPQDILTLWHNGFDDIVGGNSEVLVTQLESHSHSIAAGASSGDLPLNQPGAAIVSSVRQGRKLNNLAQTLGLMVNEGFEKQVSSSTEEAEFEVGRGLKFLVIGPSRERLTKLEKEWDKQLEDLNLARVASFADRSVFNLASIVVLAEMEGKRMLLTGDARGDFILEGLEEAGFLDDGPFHVDLLKIPHHGSDRNVTTDFFRQVTADHYVISADGRHHNPDTNMLEMLLDAREDDNFELILTNEKPTEVMEFLHEELDSGRHFKLTTRKNSEPSVAVHLGDFISL